MCGKSFCSMSLIIFCSIPTFCWCTRPAAASCKLFMLFISSFFWERARVQIFASIRRGHQVIWLLRCQHLLLSFFTNFFKQPSWKRVQLQHGGDVQTGIFPVKSAVVGAAGLNSASTRFKPELINRRAEKTRYTQILCMANGDCD